MRALLMLGLAVLLAACDQRSPTTSGREATVAGEAVLLKASDGASVHGRYYPAARARALILLFHQAGSSKDEYATIGPRLAAHGYSALAIDQRSGGDLYGHNQNVTVGSDDPGYLKAMPDLEGALAWGAAKRLPIAVLGSSYSASLAFPLAAQHRQVKAVLAFSPGEYFDDKTMIARAAGQVTVPVYVTDAGTAEEAAQAAPIVRMVRRDLLTHYIPRAGVHGASTLIPAKNPGAQTNWMPVFAFLDKTMR